jgi:hypothetical protein
MRFPSKSNSRQKSSTSDASVTSVVEAEPSAIFTRVRSHWDSESTAKRTTLGVQGRLLKVTLDAEFSDYCGKHRRL